jgi:16S rRNA (cytidine1402-2'-O)-methyltransferase
MLILVPTPIGNLEDITLRALRVLKEADLILAEDTRTTGILLKHFDIRKPLASFHIHNEHQKLKSFLHQLQEGKTIALVSDAGTPAISDPGFLLVREALKFQLQVECLPGPTAFVPALVNSGFSTDRFCFEGFLPQKKGRQTRLKVVLESEATTILYESPHRIQRLLEEVCALGFAERRISLSRELTKKFEETIRGTALELLEATKIKPPKGEYVVCIEGKPPKAKSTKKQDDNRE